VSHCTLSVFSVVSLLPESPIQALFLQSPTKANFFKPD
jgi:hypothetical protein